MVRKKGFEPSRPCGHKLLRLARLPVPPLPHEGWDYPTRISHYKQKRTMPSRHRYVGRHHDARSLVLRQSFGAEPENCGREGGIIDRTLATFTHGRCETLQLGSQDGSLLKTADKNDFGRIPESRPKLNIIEVRQAAKNRARESLAQELEGFPESRDRF